MKASVLALYGGILIAGIVAPLLFPNYTFQIAVLWMMILFALTWDIAGGQMGYNSLGNILFFGAGMYISAVVQISMVYDVGEYTAAFGAIKIDFTESQYFTGIFLGIIAAAIGAVFCALILSLAVFGLRGPYFAIGTLGCALAAAELIAGWDYVGGGGGISMPVYPGDPDTRSLFFYYMFFTAAIGTFAFLKWLYSTRFGLAINAIRDNENKAEERRGVFSGHRRRGLRQYGGIRRTIGGRFSDHHLRHLHGGDGAVGRQRNAMGSGAGRDAVSYRQGSDLDLSARLAVGGARRHHRY